MCVKDGTDSAREGDELVFQVRMAIAEDYLRRVRAGFKSAQHRAVVEKGGYLGAKAPLGYLRDDERALVRDEPKAALVLEVFERAGSGNTIRELHDYLSANGVQMTMAGVRRLLRNRAYVGEATLPGAKKGEPDVIKNHHEPIVTEAQWETAQKIRGEYIPRTGLTASASLRGLVYCGSCGKRCRLSLYGPPHDRKVQYVCVQEKCTARAGARAAALDSYVDDLVAYAVLAREPHVGAVIEGDTRYQDAQAAVDAARQDYDGFRDSIEMQRTLGIDGFAKGLKVRKEALAVARRELAKVRPAARHGKRGKLMTFDEFIAEYERDSYARFIERIVIHSAGKGRVPVEQRTDVYFIGAEQPVDATTILPVGDPKTMAILATVADAKTIMADLEDLAAKGDQSAKDYLAAKAAPRRSSISP